MLYLSGVVQPDLPAMLQPGMGNLPPAGQLWAADNGRYASPATYTDAAYLDWLGKRLPHADRCLFATAPDVVGDFAATFDLSLPMLPQIAEAGYRPALVAQDGLIDRFTPWAMFDALFIGGSTKWKLSEAVVELVSAAKKHGKWVHMGRVNSLKRFRFAAAIGCDSVDGTFLRFGPDVNRPRLDGWLADHHREPSLWRQTA